MDVEVASAGAAGQAVGRAAYGGWRRVDAGRKRKSCLRRQTPEDAPPGYDELFAIAAESAGETGPAVSAGFQAS